MRMVLLYSMVHDAERVRAVAPRHARYWRDLDLPGYLGGPFSDRSGGLITFETESVGDAERAAAGDPFVLEHLLATSVVKRWAAEAPPGTA